MKILHTYLLRQLLGRLVATSALLTVIMLLINLGRMGRIASKMGFSVAAVAASTFYVLPSILTLTLPIALLVAVVTTFGHLVDSNEYTAVRAAGIGPRWLILPALAVGALLTAASVAESGRLVEWGQTQLRANILASVRDSLADNARPGSSLVLPVGGTQTFMMNFLDAQDQRRPISISVFRGADLQESIFAAHHEIKFDVIEGLDGAEGVTQVTMTLEDGELFRDPYRVLTFRKEVVTYAIPNDLARRLSVGAGATSLSIGSNLRRQEELAAEMAGLRPALLEASADLLARGAASRDLGPGEDAAVLAAAAEVTAINNRLQSTSVDHGERAIEIQRKLSSAFAFLAFVLFGSYIGLRFGQGGTVKCGVLSLGVVSAYYLLQFAGRALATDQGRTGFMWISTAAIGLLGAIALQRYLRTT